MGKHANVRANLVSLELLDLRKRRTVGEIVAGMEHCSFGARMLGEVARTLTALVQDDNPPTLIYDGKLSTPLGKLLLDLTINRSWFRKLVRPSQYAPTRRKNDTLVVVGHYSERHEDVINAAGRTIFINPEGHARHGQVKDGHFPDAVFADPRFVMPVLALTLAERLDSAPSSMTQLFDALTPFGGVASEAAHGATTLRGMVEDPDCTVFLTLSGAMTIAKMGLVVCDMIDLGMVHYIASTGALMAHGLVESLGLLHYKHNPDHDDELLADERLNRVTDTLEPEENLDHIEDILGQVFDEVDGTRPIASHELHALIGQHLSNRYPDGRGILKSAHERGVPVVVPAFVDSELGNDLLVHNIRRERAGRRPIVINSELDSRRLMEMVTKAKRRGIFTIGGGVPRNNTQNVAPLIEIANARLDLGLPPSMFTHGCRICPDRMDLGHLSGCTYSEGASWRKFDPTEGRRSEIHADATQIWPFMVRYVMDAMRV